MTAFAALANSRNGFGLGFMWTPHDLTRTGRRYLKCFWISWIAAMIAGALGGFLLAHR